MYRKFHVERADGMHQPGCKHYGCDYFVIDLTHDPDAPAVLAAKAQACAARQPRLAVDLMRTATEILRRREAEAGDRVPGFDS
jgi:hypothetical protein